MTWAPTGPTNVELRKLIRDLKKAAREYNAPVWRDVAERLSRPRRQRAEVNVGKLDGLARRGVIQEEETVLVPGKVLGDGVITQPLRVAAWKFSRTARAKIEAVGGECLTIRELLEENPEGSYVRIIE
ncbi:50S ribosomal protein L18e [Methanopyrus sp. KOL6]|uniref:50S ribosomal protein L18e n=1 Tax=Methanopyrus sp. KOL6 TaxID=1937004 RepID=UPI000B4A78AF|nr:50S ribosomal protein L18e [Methanopyrus sp. KOL6]